MIKLIVMGFLILLIIINFIIEPKLSINYYVSLIKSGIKMIGGIIKLGIKSIGKDNTKEINQTKVISE